MSNWNSINKQDQYDLNTPFGSTAKDPFKASHKDDSFDSPFSGNTQKCPGCGANLLFDAETGSVRCTACGNVYDPKTMEMNGSLGIENPEQEYGIGDQIDYEDRGNKEIVCNSCGSQIVTDANTAATMCPFCGSPAIVTRNLTRQFRPDAILPFSITKDKAIELYKERISSLKYVPKAFTRESTVNKITGIYVPFWLLSCDVKMDIAGWTHTVIDGSKYYDPVKQEETGKHAIDIPVDGEVEFSLKNIPFDGSRKIANKLMQACEPFDLSGLVPYNASFLTGFLAEKYDTQPKDMYEVIKKRLDNYCHDVAEKVKFEDVDAFTYNSSYTWINYKNYKIIYCLLPIWFLNVKYNDRDYRFAINGQTGEVCGVVPESFGGSIIRRVAEKVNNLTFQLNRTARHMFYVIPSICLGLIYGLARTGLRMNSFITLIIVTLFVLAIVGAMGVIICPLLVQKEKERDSVIGVFDPHRLDKMPDVSYYLDTTKKIKARKKLTPGGVSGIRI